MDGGKEPAEIVVRAAVAADFEQISAIYRASVETTAASFELVAPDADEMRRRWRRVLDARLPYLVAERAGVVGGFAYARPFHERAAFAWTVENSVYIAAECARQGVGRMLLASLIEATTAAGFRQMIALVSSDAAAASLPLHIGLGFREVGRLDAVGYKHGRWHDIIQLQRALGAGGAIAPS